MLEAKPPGNSQETNNPNNNKPLKRPISQNKIVLNLHKSGLVLGESMGPPTLVGPPDRDPSLLI